MSNCLLPDVAPHHRLRAVFMGTPPFAATILHRVLECPFVETVAVYTQPDRPVGRSKELKAPAVKELALERGLTVRQPPNFKHDADVDALAAFAPDVLLVAAYGMILPQRVLHIPKILPINVHASLLPKYRGAAPIQRSIMNGDSVTGITIMRMERGLDTGPMLMQRAVGIDINDTAEMLQNELALEGAELLILALERLTKGTLGCIPQEDSRASHAPKLSKDDGLIDFSQSARAVHAHIRGATPWPGAHCILRRKDGQELSVQAAPGIFPLPPGMQSNCPPEADSLPQPGTIIGLREGALLVACGDGCYAFTVLKPSGKKSMDGAAFYNGYVAGTDTAVFEGKAPLSFTARREAYL